MSIGAAQIKQIITMGRTAFPTRVVTVKWENKQNSVTALRGDESNRDEGDIAGVIDNLQGVVYVITDECDPMGPPGTGDQIWINDVEYACLGQSDIDADGTVRRLFYGEDSA